MYTLLKSSGILRYSSENNQHRLVVEIDNEIARYYRSLIPKHIEINKPKYSSHITVVRPYKEIPINLNFWNKYEGQEIEFEYWNYIFTGKTYFWLNVFCKQIEKIRAELGLSIISEFIIPPEGYKKCFHCTIGNKKPILNLKRIENDGRRR